MKIFCTIFFIDKFIIEFTISALSGTSHFLETANQYTDQLLAADDSI